MQPFPQILSDKRIFVDFEPLRLSLMCGKLILNSAVLAWNWWRCNVFNSSTTFHIGQTLVTSLLILSDPGVSYATVSSLFLSREKERDVWAPCLLFGVSSDGFNYSWVPPSFPSLISSIHPFIFLLQLICTPTTTSDHQCLSLLVSSGLVIWCFSL